MKYLKNYDRYSDYDRDMQHIGLIPSPFVAYCRNNDTVYYLKKDIVSEYQCLGIQALEDSCVIELNVEGTTGQKLTDTYMSRIDYSIDGGQTWVETDVSSTGLTVGTTVFQVTLMQSEILLVRGCGKQTCDAPPAGGARNSARLQFSSDGTFKIKGDIMGLLCRGVIGIPSHTFEDGSESNFASLFQDCIGLVDASELILTNDTKSGCYKDMFYGCTNLVSAPVLPATTLTEYCYYGMFYNCTSLNYIKAMFTTTPSTNVGYTDTQNWVYGVSATGTFVKNRAALWDLTGVNGVPSGWTVQTASA